MAVYATLLGSPTPSELRRTLGKTGARVAACRSAAVLERLLAGGMVEALIASPRGLPPADLRALRRRWRHLPVVLYGPFRPDDGRLLVEARRDLAGLALAGVDDAILPHLLQRVALTGRRRRALAAAPRLLRLTEPLQRNAWDLLLTDVERPLHTGDVARRLGVSREHLSRQFAAGGAPHLKRVIDLTRVAAAAQLLASAGYTAADVARLLAFSSARHLAATAERICGAPLPRLAALGPGGVLAGFVKGKTRSR